jgi:hypothetical protein
VASPFDVLLVVAIYTLLALIWSGIIVAIVLPIVLISRLFQRLGDRSAKAPHDRGVLVRAAHRPHI